MVNMMDYCSMKISPYIVVIFYRFFYMQIYYFLMKHFYTVILCVILLKFIGRKIYGSILKYIHQAGNEPTWIFSMPLFHFLHGYSQPFKPLNIQDSHQSKSNAWWGIQDLSKHVDNFKKSQISNT